MKKGKLITIEGTDGSGKGTQTELLYNRMKEDRVEVLKYSFPVYSSPTGKIVGGCYLGKTNIGECYFEKGADAVDYKVAGCYFASDRRYNCEKWGIKESLNNGTNIILDRYVESNMAHQGGKITNITKRFEAYQFLHELEYKLMELKKPDITIFLYVPYDYSERLRKIRNEILDQHESNPEHLRHAEEAYLELEKLYNFKRIECIKNGEMRSREDINEEVYYKVKNLILKK